MSGGDGFGELMRTEAAKGAGPCGLLALLVVLSRSRVRPLGCVQCSLPARWRAASARGGEGRVEAIERAGRGRPEAPSPRVRRVPTSSCPSPAHLLASYKPIAMLASSILALAAVVAGPALVLAQSSSATGTSSAAVPSSTNVVPACALQCIGSALPGTPVRLSRSLRMVCTG